MPTPQLLDRKDIKGVILCGGRSTRFRRSKAHFMFEGMSLVELALRIIEPLVDEVTLAIGNSEESRWPNVPLVSDRISGIGPLGGIHAALHEMIHEWLLVLPVDLPFMTTRSLSGLVHQARTGDVAVVAEDGTGRMHPLCALYHRSILPLIEDAIDRKEYGATRLLSGIESVRYVTFPDEEVRNVNRPEDLP